MISSVQYTLSFITTFFEEIFSQSRNYYENIMILWYYQIRPKVIWKVHGASWIDGYDSQNKDQIINITKNKQSVIFFLQCIIAKTIWFPPCYWCHLRRHLKYFTMQENNNNMLVKFSRYNWNCQKIVTNCKFDFRLNFALNGGHLGHHHKNFNLVNQTCECFILIVCCIWPLDKKSKLKWFISSFFSQIGLRNLTDGHLWRHL